MKKIAVVLILCILAVAIGYVVHQTHSFNRYSFYFCITYVAIGYVVHQTHSSTEFQLGESGIANNIAFVVIDYEFSESYISEYGRIAYPEEGAKFLWLYVKAANLGEVAQEIPDGWDVDILYKGTTIYRDYAHPKERKMYAEGSVMYKIYPGVSDDGWALYQVPINFHVSQAKVRVDFPQKAGKIFGEKTLTWSFGS